MTLAERERAARTRLNYPPGTRIELKSMAHDPDPVPPGTRGTVYNVNGYGDIEMNWDTKIIDTLYTKTVPVGVREYIGMSFGEEPLPATMKGRRNRGRDQEEQEEQEEPIDG